MPSTKSYRSLHDTVFSRDGATERLEALREETLAEIGLYELRAVAFVIPHMSTRLIGAMV